MSAYQHTQDYRHLTRANRAIIRLAGEIPGAEFRATGEVFEYDDDTSVPVLALVVGPLAFTIDWLNVEEDDDYWIIVRRNGEYVGYKTCRSRPHFDNAVKKMVGMDPDDLYDYLAGRLTGSRR